MNNTPSVEKVDDNTYRLTYKDFAEFPYIGLAFVHQEVEYKVKEVIAANSDELSFDVTVEQ